MSKNSLGRFPSVRNNTTFQKRESSKDNNNFALTSDQIIDTPQSNKKVFQQTSLSQTEITKKIQNKIRMRKASGSQKKLTATYSGKSIEGLSFNQFPDPIQNIKQQINNLWENSQYIYDALTQSAIPVSSDQLKQAMIQESSFILCQVNKGQNLETILVEKIKKKIQMKKCIKKCQEKQNSVKSMFDDRLVKLSMILRTR